MEQEVDTAMHAGAFGITSALIYPPSSFQTTDDLIALAKVASRMRRLSTRPICATRARSWSPRSRKRSRIGEKGGVKVEIFHLKAAYAPGWGKLMPQAVATIEAARARGVDVAADMYPYPAGGTGLDITVPNWVWADGVEKGDRAAAAIRQGARPAEARSRRRFAAGLVQPRPGLGRLGPMSSSPTPSTRNIDSSTARASPRSARRWARIPPTSPGTSCSPACPNRAMALYFMMSEQDIETALRQPWVSIGSDAGVGAKLGEIDALGLPHPRAYGTFPRIIAEYVKRRHVLTLEDAVRKMTSWPAQRMGLTDRGLIREGMRADVVVFDLDKLEDVAELGQTPPRSRRGSRP